MQPGMYWQGKDRITLSSHPMWWRCLQITPFQIAPNLCLVSLCLPRRPLPFCINPPRDARDFVCIAQLSRNGSRNLYRECKSEGLRSRRHLGVPKHMRHKAMIISSGESQNGLTRVLGQGCYCGRLGCSTILKYARPKPHKTSLRANS